MDRGLKYSSPFDLFPSTALPWAPCCFVFCALVKSRGADGDVGEIGNLGEGVGADWLEISLPSVGRNPTVIPLSLILSSFFSSSSHLQFVLADLPFFSSLSIFACYCLPTAIGQLIEFLHGAVPDQARGRQLRGRTRALSRAHDGCLGLLRR